MSNPPSTRLLNLFPQDDYRFCQIRMHWVNILFCVIWMHDFLIPVITERLELGDFLEI